MASPVEKIFDAVAKQQNVNGPQNMAESFFDSIGMMRGDSAPILRAGAGAVLGGIVMFAFRPSFSFNKDGSAKTFAETPVPWWGVAGVVGVVCGA